MPSHDLKPPRDVGITSISVEVPKVIIFPPSEEDLSDPCISFAPNESLIGLPNPHKTKPRSALNSFLQLFSSLPHINEELPISSSCEKLREFVDMIRHLQCDGNEDEIRVADEEILKLDWWRDACQFPCDDNEKEGDALVQDVEIIIKSLFTTILSKTRFGKRFQMSLTSSPPSPTTQLGKPRTDSGISLSDDSLTTTLLTIPLDTFPTTQTIPLTTLLNTTLNHSTPIFYFGGSTTHPSILQHTHPKASPLASPSQDQLKFTLLPHYLTLHFHRPLSSSSGYHPTPIELPTEIDLGFYLHLSPSHENEKTFYRLHGFVTQKDGKFITYTTLRGGNRWYRCEDEVVKEYELGSRVESKGVMVAVYRLQDH